MTIIDALRRPAADALVSTDEDPTPLVMVATRRALACACGDCVACEFRAARERRRRGA